jgi:hypothetical protein
MQTKDSPRLTIAGDDTESPARFTGPCGTVTCEVDEDVLNVFVKPEAHPADWDLAVALMRSIVDPARALAKAQSALTSVEWFQIRLV